jgi:hypothetical protein
VLKLEFFDYVTFVLLIYGWLCFQLRLSFSVNTNIIFGFVCGWYTVASLLSFVEFPLLHMFMTGEDARFEPVHSVVIHISVACDLCLRMVDSC